jgi:hypothetical protein
MGNARRHTKVVFAGEHDATVAMPAARANGQKVLAEDINTSKDTWPPPLTCLYCATPVVAVRSSTGEHKRQAAHFRLGRNERHRAGCDFDVHAQVTELIELGDGLLQRRRDGYRLVLPETLAQPRPRLADRHSSDRAEPTYARKARTLLNTAAKVNDLVEKYRLHGGDLHELFHATCGGRRVSWAEFFHLPRAAWRLGDRLKNGPLEHPVAVALKVRFSGPSRTGETFYVEQRAPAAWSDTNRGQRYHLVIRSREEALLQPYYQQGTWVLALGLWELFEWRGGNRTDICLWVDSPEQIVTIPAPPAMTTSRSTAG